MDCGKELEKAEALRKEIDEMLSELDGNWQVGVVTTGDRIYWAAAGNGLRILVAGCGRTKAEALEKLLENWRDGQSEPYAPAAGSAEELRLKLAVMKS
jgi:hypothetical protein